MERAVDWATEAVSTRMYICWSAQAALYQRYGVPKVLLPAKLFGVFPHLPTPEGAALLAGCDDVLDVSQSRLSDNRVADVAVSELDIIALGDAASVYIAGSRDRGELHRQSATAART